MTVSLDTALSALHQALDDTVSPHWRWRLRQQLSAVRDALASQQVDGRDGWLAARADGSDRDRNQLMARAAALGPRVLTMLDGDRLRGELSRLVADLDHYRQRVHDIAYDSVALELGGSE
jgi:hypothetical protein